MLYLNWNPLKGTRVWATNRDGAVTGDNSGKRGLILDDIDVQCQTYWEKKRKILLKRKAPLLGSTEMDLVPLRETCVYLWLSDSIFQIRKFVTKVSDTEELAKLTSRAIPLLSKTEALNKTSSMMFRTRRDHYSNPLAFMRRWCPKRSPQFVTLP